MKPRDLFNSNIRPLLRPFFSDQSSAFFFAIAAAAAATAFVVPLLSLVRSLQGGLQHLPSVRFSISWLRRKPASRSSDEFCVNTDAWTLEMGPNDYCHGYNRCLPVFDTSLWFDFQSLACC
ncbi:hypothetical protein LY76DRAFT_599077, partial [Colletotrichum caudatum]